jgi:hypothetical protein
VAAVTVDVVDVDAVAAEDAVVPEDEDAASKPDRKVERATQKHAVWVQAGARSEKAHLATHQNTEYADSIQDARS